MSPETDQPRQRTVAELLAEYGDGPSATGRRRARRPADAEVNGGRSRDPGPPPAAPQRPPAPPPPAPPPPAARPAAPPPAPPRMPRAPDLLREDPTDVMPRITAEPPPRDEFGGPDRRTPPATNGRSRPPAADAGPSTMVGGAPVGAERWHRERTAGSGRPPAPVEAPPLAEPARRDPDDRAPDVDELDADLDDDHDLDDDLDDEYDDYDEIEEQDEDGAGSADGTEGRARGAAWAAVVAQWIAGAIGGAALWVGFRFLWQDLPVVAIAAAVLVTVALVVVVRALLRNNDLRTTIFAVLVGLLLTVSPAILVLIGR